MPDFIPLERTDHHAVHQHSRKPNSHKSPPFQNKKISYKSRDDSKERYLNRRESSVERQKRKHSPITHHSSSQPKKYRSKSPVNLKVTARVRSHDHVSAFSRLGSYDASNGHALQIMPQTTSNQVFVGHESSMRNDRHSQNIIPLVPASSRDRINVTIQTDDHPYNTPPNYRESLPPEDDDRNEELNIADRLEKLEREKKQLMVHCNGIRDTVDEYCREISKMQSLIYTWSEEISILKRRIYKK